MAGIDYSNSYPKDPTWTLKTATANNIQEVADKINMSVEKLLSKIITMPHKEATIQVADYVVLFSFIAISAIIGLYFAWEARNEKNKKEKNSYDFAQQNKVNANGSILKNLLFREQL